MREADAAATCHRGRSIEPVAPRRPSTQVSRASPFTAYLGSHEAPPHVEFRAHFPHICICLFWCGLGAAVGVTLALYVVSPPVSPFLLVSLGGSAIFLLGLTRASAARPRSLFGSHQGGALFSIACYKTVHSPTGANPVIMIHRHAGLAALWQPVLVGTLALDLSPPCGVACSRSLALPHRVARPLATVATGSADRGRPRRLPREFHAYPLLTTPSCLLDWRAPDRPERTEYTAIPSVGVQQRLASRALVIELTRVRRHEFQFLEAALRASDDGLKSERAHQWLICEQWPEILH